jgi:hypothetical protein
VAGGHVRVEVRGAIAEGHVVDLERQEVALDGGADPQDFAVVLGRFGFGEMVRLDHVAAAPDDHRVPAHQSAPGQVRVGDGPGLDTKPDAILGGPPLIAETADRAGHALLPVLGPGHDALSAF